MKAKELMIGDWVQIVEPCKYEGAIGRIKTLIDHKDDENAYFKVFLQNNTIHIGIEDVCSEDIRPIPLTPEILEKNGFKKDERNKNLYKWNWGVIDDCISYDIETGKARIFIVISLTFSKVLEFVHELQHAMRICGIEKEIEL